MADWLNFAFKGLDGGIFNAMNLIQCQALNLICKWFSYLGEKGLGFILGALILMLFPKTRKVGVTAGLAIAIGALFTNVIIKNLVARPRPYTTNAFFGFWESAGANLESEHSFPSGHTTACTAFSVAFFLAFKKKWGWVALLMPPVMAFCRVYLIVHYFTDVVAGLIVGTVGGVLALVFTNLIYKQIEKRQDNKFCAFVLNWHIKDLFAKNK